jgi:hypothetical protein
VTMMMMMMMTMMMMMMIIIIIIIIIIGKVQPRTGHEGPEGEHMYSSTLSLTSALDGVGGQCHDPAALLPGKNRYPLYRRLGGPQDRSGRVWKISPPSGFDPRTVQPVASPYTDCAIPVPCNNNNNNNNNNNALTSMEYSSEVFPVCYQSVFCYHSLAR